MSSFFISIINNIWATIYLLCQITGMKTWKVVALTFNQLIVQWDEQWQRHFQNNGKYCELASYKNLVCVFLYYQTGSSCGRCCGSFLRSPLQYSVFTYFSSCQNFCQLIVHSVVPLMKGAAWHKVKSLPGDNSHSVWLLLGTEVACWIRVKSSLLSSRTFHQIH